jgi:hypothetical protein
MISLALETNLLKKKFVDAIHNRDFKVRKLKEITSLKPILVSRAEQSGATGESKQRPQVLINDWMAWLFAKP